MPVKVITIVGARPQFIKAAVVSRAFRSFPKVHESLLHTGQHYDASMSDVFFEEMEIPKPRFNLEVGSGSHGFQTGRMMEGIESVFLNEKPDLCLVYGDTNSTLAGALVAAKLHIPVAHVEAGLRSFNRKMPEEINRVMTDHVSDWLFCPTEVAVKNLTAEGLGGRRVLNVGDVMLDAALFYSKKSTSRILDKLSLQEKKYALVTIHRAENTDHPANLESIFLAIKRLSEKMPVVLPLHPRTKKILASSDLLNDSENSNLRLIDPVGYLDMITLTKKASMVMTDSGGLQKEAFFFRVPCLTLRAETEWTELVESGWNRIADPALGSEELVRSLESQLGRTGREFSPYGDGHAGQKIAKVISDLEI